MPDRLVRKFSSGAAWLWQHPAYVVAILTLVFVLQGAVLGCQVRSTRQASQQAKHVALENRELTKQNVRLARENRRRIAEIQASRIASCRQTYSALAGLFRPVIPPGQTPAQQARTDKFFALIEKKKKQCAKQVRTRPPKSNS